MVIDRISAFKWSAILERINEPTGNSKHKLFNTMHSRAVDAFIVDPDDNTHGRELLGKPGACQSLFHRALRLIGESRSLSRSTPGALPSNSGINYLRLHILTDFIRCFTSCLGSHPPFDHETDALVNLANRTLRELRPIVVEWLFATHNSDQGFQP
jgi:hypothetical protein